MALGPSLRQEKISRTRSNPLLCAHTNTTSYPEQALVPLCQSMGGVVEGLSMVYSQT